ncbi:MAG: hypothetical protein L6R35_005646 [Caloplaca aegaea]|nr:MAG: hypothetical protein L6R35_005646 [Caloplaca aegaea]
MNTASQPEIEKVSEPVALETVVKTGIFRFVVASISGLRGSSARPSKTEEAIETSQSSSTQED